MDLLIYGEEMFNFISDEEMAPKKSKKNGGKKQAKKCRKIFRCTLLHLLKLVKKVKLKITEAHIEEIKKTTFWPLFNIFYEEMIDEGSLKQTTSGILSILETYVIRELGFNIGTKTLTLKPEDISITFGLKMKGVQVQPFNGRKDKFYKKSQFCKCYFGEATTVSRAQIEARIESIVEIKGKEEDFVKLIILHMASSIFFTSSAGSEISINFVQYIEDYKSINSISWPRTIHGYLMEKVKKNREEPIKISGCVIQLLYWICEHACIVDAIEGAERRFPRAARWNLNQIAKTLPEKIKILQVNEISEDFLVALTPEERELLITDQEEEVPIIQEANPGHLNENKMLQEENSRLQETLSEALKEKEKIKNKKAELVVKLTEVEEENRKHLNDLERTRELLKEVQKENKKIKDDVYSLQAARTIMSMIPSEEEKDKQHYNMEIREEEEQQSKDKEEETPNKNRSWIKMIKVKQIKEKKIDNDFVVEPFKKKQKKNEGKCTIAQNEEKKKEGKFSYHELLNLITLLDIKICKFEMYIGLKQLQMFKSMQNRLCK